jgi:hypothetical protein
MRFCFLLVLGMIAGCSAVSYNTSYVGNFDPTFSFKNVKTIGFTPYYWTSFAKENKIDELEEKQYYAYAKKFFEHEGFKVSYLEPEYLREDSAKHISIKGMGGSPDLLLDVFYYQGDSDIVYVPGETVAWGSVSKTGGGGAYRSSEGYAVKTYSLRIRYTLRSGQPLYRQKVWSGGIIQDSPTLNLDEQREDMVRSIFRNKWTWEKK